MLDGNYKRKVLKNKKRRFPFTGSVNPGQGKAEDKNEKDIS